MTQKQVFRGVATMSYTSSSGVTIGRYHNTDVVTMKPALNQTSRYVEITLDTGGWRTATTKTRMNQFADQHGINYRVFQKNGDWFVDSALNGTFVYTGRVVTFTETLR